MDNAHLDSSEYRMSNGSTISKHQNKPIRKKSECAVLGFTTCHVFLICCVCCCNVVVSVVVSLVYLNSGEFCVPVSLVDLNSDTPDWASSPCLWKIFDLKTSTLTCPVVFGRSPPYMAMTTRAVRHTHLASQLMPRAQVREAGEHTAPWVVVAACAPDQGPGRRRRENTSQPCTKKD